MAGFSSPCGDRDAGIQFPGVARVAATPAADPAGPTAAGSFPRPDRRRVSLPEVHRQICDWLRLQAAKELLWREFMTVPERIPA